MKVGDGLRVKHDAFAGQVGEVTEVHGTVYVVEFNGPNLWGSASYTEFELKWFGAEVVPPAPIEEVTP